MQVPKTTASTDRPQIGVGGFQISDKAKALVMEVLDSNRLTAGPMMARFEREFADVHACQFALMCNSGTSALQIALAALKERHGWEDGDEVLVPALTFVATSNVVLYNGLTPVFVDVDPVYYTLDPARIEERITARTRAIMPVHLGGLPCEMGPILDVAAKHDLRIVEDSAETMFAEDHGRPVGSFGDVGCFSTYAAHVITTGVGGLCTTNDPELFVMLKSLMNHGRDSIYIRMDDDQGVHGQQLLEMANRRFSFVRLGHSFRCTEMEAALGVAELEGREMIVAARRRNAARLTTGLASLAEHLQLPQERPGADHVYMFYPITLRSPDVSRDALLLHLEEGGIETRHLLPLINQPIYRQLFGDLDAEYPVAARLNSHAFYVGCHPDMTEGDIAYVIEQFHAFFRKL